MSKTLTQTASQRPDARRSRGFSFRSHKSSENKKQETSPKSQKALWPETTGTLDTRLQSKMDPNRALYESQPMDEALTSQTSDFTAMRTMEHRDIHGRVISEPDRSNPTRHRFERPLDTIRALDARIERTYDAAMPPESPTNGGDNRRRSGFYGTRSTNGSRLGLDQYAAPPRPSSYRPPSMIERYGSRDRRDPSPGNFGPGRGYADPQHWQAHPPRQNSIYPSPAHQNPYDTVPSAEGSYNTEPWGASTDPSSESSSIDRRASGYRIDGNDAVYRDPSSQDLYTLGSSNGKAYQVQQPNGHQNHAQQYAHSIPRTELNHPSGLQKSRLGSQAPFNHSLPETLRVPIKLNGPPAQQSAGADKRRSWLRRTMSRNR